MSDLTDCSVKTNNTPTPVREALTHHQIERQAIVLQKLASAFSDLIEMRGLAIDRGDNEHVARIAKRWRLLSVAAIKEGFVYEQGRWIANSFGDEPRIPPMPPIKQPVVDLNQLTLDQANEKLDAMRKRRRLADDAGKATINEEIAEFITAMRKKGFGFAGYFSTNPALGAKTEAINDRHRRTKRSASNSST